MKLINCIIIFVLSLLFVVHIGFAQGHEPVKENLYQILRLLIFDNMDCNGDEQGTAYIDSCGTCVGGYTGKDSCDQDCNGDGEGTAYLDDCNICVGGNTGKTPCRTKTVFITSNLYDAKFNDEFKGADGLTGADYICNSLAQKANLSGVYMAWLSTGSVSPADRFTKYKGRYVLRDGTVIAENWDDLTDGTIKNPINITEKNQPVDPANPKSWTNTTPDGTVEFADSIHNCANFTTNATDWKHLATFGNATRTDEFWTSSWGTYDKSRLWCFDPQHLLCVEQCVGGDTDDINCIPDCSGDLGGAAYTDNCGTCVGGNTGEIACIQDCYGDWGGSAYTDNCGTCVGGNTGEIACTQDCYGDWGGTAYTDNCGTCVGGNTGETACIQDCNNEWGGTAYYDECVICVGGSTGKTACVQDCNNEWGGTATEDNCGVCDSDAGNDNTTCVQDCNGVWNGTAYIDPNCGGCVGGTTGNEPCTQDCYGEWGGAAVINSCGCAGGNTGVDETVTCVTSLGQVWVDRNLGASQAATSPTDTSAYGDLYQWGRDNDGHEIRNSATTSTLSATDTPGHSNFITGVSDWRSPQNNDLWQAASNINNPCPSGFRAPTQIEWNTQLSAWSPPNANSAYLSPLKLVMPGARVGSTGAVTSENAVGGYWTSTTSGTSSMYLRITPTGDSATTSPRVHGRSVRCIKD